MFKIIILFSSIVSTSISFIRVAFYFSSFSQYSCFFYSWLIISSSTFFYSSSWEAILELCDNFSFNYLFFLLSLSISSREQSNYPSRSTHTSSFFPISVMLLFSSYSFDYVSWTMKRTLYSNYSSLSEYE